MSWRRLAKTVACGMFATTALQPASAAVQPSSTDVPAMCSYLEHIANADPGALDTVTLQGRSSQDAALPLPAGVARDLVTFQGRIDVDNDGRIDTVHITKGSGSGAALFIYGRDTAAMAYAADQADFWKDDARSRAETLRPLRFAGKIYLAAFNANALRFVAIISNSTKRLVCEFEQHQASDALAITTALNEYQSIVRSATAKHLPLWLYAFSQDDLAVADTLLDNGHTVDDMVDSLPILSWAVRHDREDVVDWLTSRGADVEAGRSANETPLGQALQTKNAALAVRFINLGVDPTKFIASITEFANARPESGSEVIKAVVARLQYIPEEFVSVAVRRAPLLLDVLLASDLPIQSVGSYWRAGENTPIPPALAREAALSNDSSLQQKLQQLFNTRRVSPPKEHFAALSYGIWERGFEITRAHWSQLSDAELLLFSTSICSEFLSADCGSQDLVARARAWAEALPYPCAVDLERSLDPIACKVALHAKTLSELVTDNAVRIIAVSTGVPNNDFLRVNDLRRLYVEKHGGPTASE